MNIRTLAVTCLLLAGQPHAHAGDAGASEASIRELLVLTDSESMIDNLWAQVEAMMESASKQALAGRPVTEAQQVILDDMHMEMLALLREELSWPVYEPMMIDIFRSTFTEEELQGMLAFYRSPAGRAVTAKMPAVLQASMQFAQGRMSSLQPKLLQLQEDTARRLKEAQ